MDAMVYLGQENDHLNTSSIKSRQRLQSAPERLLKTPLKSRLGASAQSGRKALSTVNKIVTTPATSHKVEPLSKPIASQCKVAPQTTEHYPEIEMCFPYNPSDFEEYSVPDEVCLSRFSLAGLGKLKASVPVLEDDFTMMDICTPLSPLKIPSESCRDDLTAFLETISELTVDLPPECD